MTRIGRGVAGFLLVGLLGCTAGPPRPVAPQAPPPPPLIRVGMSADAPPISFMREGKIVGVEPDLAQAVVDQLRRPMALVPMRFDALMPALLNGTIDVIMSGLTITPARRVRLAFSDPYMRSGLLAAALRTQASQYATRDAIMNAGANVGVRMGSTAESWGQSNLRFGRVVPYPSIEDAARELSQGRLDLIISDAPQTAWAVSEFSATLQVIPIRLTQEEIAWAFRPEDAALRNAANRVLADMRRDGRLHAILARWIPFLDKLERAR
jgi:ABC-type amino acid transport substrate-binding protein